MPLSPYQAKVALLLSSNRSEDSHLAGGAALHHSRESLRLSEDLDYFHDSDVRVAQAFEEDRKLLEGHGHLCQVEIRQPGYIRCIVSQGGLSTKVEWAYDTSWRFLPVQFIEGLGYVLHPIDLAINKLLALCGRDEPRDYLDVMHAHEKILSLGALIWGACGKDPGLSPNLVLELLKRRGKLRPEDFAGLNISQPVDLQTFKKRWLAALAEAEDFIEKAPPEQLGVLFYSEANRSFFAPDFSKKEAIVFHRGAPGGVRPIVKT